MSIGESETVREQGTDNNQTEVAQDRYVYCRLRDASMQPDGNAAVLSISDELFVNERGRSGI
jgi:hypothetical protein